MKKFSLLLVGLLCLSVVVYAGDVITNDTGEDATGLRVAFSQPVLITAFGDILTSVDPQMLSFEFVFSGGTVKPWESHWFNYAPTTANVMETEWLTGPIVSDIPQGSLTREDLLNLGRAPTYEEIMSVIAEYPGEDEPLYEPAPDEAIWLTDLEGHADIYDNDSIKINYADWFDQSQITGIEVYRNGIRMRFLPDLLDVLTNGQMKTFDGNPTENTPASAHTDHAIWGYEYKFQLQVAPGHETIEPLVVTVRPSLTNDWDFAYINILGWPQLLDYGWASDAVLEERLRGIKAQGWKGISLDYWVCLESMYPTDVLPCRVGETITTNDSFYDNPTDEDFTRFLLAAEHVGLDVEVRVQMHVSNEYKAINTNCTGGCRSEIAPTEIESFFMSYGDLCCHVAEVMEANGGDMLTVLVEANSLEPEESMIENLLSRVREGFTGRLAISQSTHHYLRGDSLYESEYTTLLELLDLARFWDWNDPIGLGAEICMNLIDVTLDDSLDQVLPDMVESCVQVWTAPTAYYRNHYPLNALSIGELAVIDRDGAAMLGWLAEKQQREPDLQEEADMIAAILTAAKWLGLDGFSYLYDWFVWRDAMLWEGANPHVAYPDAPVRRLLCAFLEGTYSPSPFLGDPPYAQPVISGPLQYPENVSVTARIDWVSVPVSETASWGLPGSDVKSVEVSVFSGDLLIELELHTDGLTSGSFDAYALDILLPSGDHTYVLLIPGDRSVILEYYDGTINKYVDTISGAGIALAPQTMSVLIPIGAFGSLISEEDLCNATFSLALEASPGEHDEIFWFPGQAAVDCQQ